MFCDQSGFYLLPMVVRTYASVGKTPILREHLSRDRLSAMSGITLEGKPYMVEQERAFKGEDVVRFSEALDAPNPRQAVGDLGRLSDPPQPSGQGLFGRWGGFSGATGATTTRLCSGSEPRRRGLEAPEVRGVEESLLPEPIGVEDRATQGKGAVEAQEARHPRLPQTTGLRGLDVCAEISNTRRISRVSS